MKDTIDDVLCTVGVVLVVILMVAGIFHKSNTDALIDECEDALPRDQHCVLVAVPEAK